MATRIRLGLFSWEIRVVQKDPPMERGASASSPLGSHFHRTKRKESTSRSSQSSRASAVRLLSKDEEWRMIAGICRASRASRRLKRFSLSTSCPAPVRRTNRERRRRRAKLPNSTCGMRTPTDSFNTRNDSKTSYGCNFPKFELS